MPHGSVEIIQINHQAVTLRDLLRQAILTDSLPALEQSIDHAILMQWAKELDLHVTNEELMIELTAFRKNRGLYTAAKTKEWLEQHGLQPEDLSKYLRPILLREKLAASTISDEEIERHFHQNVLDYNQAEISQILVAEHGEAQELKFRLEEGVDFFLLAREFSLDANTQMAGGYIGIISRKDVEPEMAALIFGGSAGQVVGPLETKQGFVLLKIEEQWPAMLDEQTSAEIRESLFLEKFRMKKQHADIDVNLWKLMVTDNHLEQGE